MKTFAAPLPLLALMMMAASADAQTMNSSGVKDTVSPLIQTNTQYFSFTADGAGTQNEQQKYCLQEPNELIKVISVTPQSSNAESVVHVNGDPNTNCINLSVELPSANKVCTNVPAPTFSRPDGIRNVCTTIPTMLGFTVTYESRVDVDKTLGDGIYQIDNLMTSANSGCAGGAHGYPPNNWSSLQGHGRAALAALSAAKAAWANGQTPDAVQQINSAKSELDAFVNGLSMSCSGSAHGLDPFSYSAYVATRASVEGKLDVIRSLLGS